MFKTIRVAGLAAAAAFLCTGNSAAASETDQQPQVSPAVHAAAATPATPASTETPAAPALQPQAAVQQAPLQQAVVPVEFNMVADHSTADAALTPGRTRPDRPSATAPAPLPAQSAGVTAAAGARRSLDDLVAEHAGAESGDEAFQCLASAVYFESRGEPLAGQLAVAEVILNRVKSGRFRSTVCDVVKQPSQFSFVRRGVIPQPKRETAAWQRAVAIAHIAMNDLHDVTGEESLFFHATYVNPGWGRPRIARIGNHIFYR
jgi:spore germination cell wall hydrolase CwlJ-like protein